MIYALKFITLLITFPFFKKEKPNPPPEKEEPKEVVDYKLQASIYRTIIERYRNEIEANEYKTIPQLRTLINPNNPAIQKIKNKILDEFHPYIYERDFLVAVDKAFNFLQNEIKTESLPIDFWLEPEEILKLGAADEMDKLIFFCSLLIALNNSSAKVVVGGDGERCAAVIFEFMGDYYLYNPAYNIKVQGKTKDDVLLKYLKSHKGVHHLLYEFNDREYNEW